MANDIVDWGHHIGTLVLDRLVDEGLLKRADFDVALAAATEEIQIRPALGDYPPSNGHDSTPT